MLEMKCQGVKIHPCSKTEKASMLIVGGSRMGKTYFASLYGNHLIDLGSSVHLIDLDSNWNSDDRMRIGIKKVRKAESGQKTVLCFPDGKALYGCGKVMLDALGSRSGKMLLEVNNALKGLLGRCQEFSLQEILQEMAKNKEGQVYSETLSAILDDSEAISEMIYLKIDAAEAENMADTSTIWDFSRFDGKSAKVMVQLVLHALYSVQRSRFQKGEIHRRVYIIIDEFQNLGVENTLISKCLTEGQKSRIYLILLTQFLQGKFKNEAINELKQGGFKVFFRLTEEEAGQVSRQLGQDVSQQQYLKHKLCSLERGECLFIGPHNVDGRKEVTEKIRFVRISNKDIQCKDTITHPKKNIIFVSRPINSKQVARNNPVYGRPRQTAPATPQKSIIKRPGREVLPYDPNPSGR